MTITLNIKLVRNCSLPLLGTPALLEAVFHDLYILFFGKNYVNNISFKIFHLILGIELSLAIKIIYEKVQGALK